MSRGGSLMLVLVLAGCGGEPVRPLPMTRVFVADAVGEGAALFTRAELRGDELAVAVVGRKLGPVLGYAFRLDAEGATVPDAAVEPVLSNAMWFTRGGRVGAALRGTEQAVEDETVLARWTLKVGDAPVRLRVVASSVRRANGDGVIVSLGGGAL